MTDAPKTYTATEVEAMIGAALEEAANEAKRGWLYQYETAPDRIRALHPAAIQALERKLRAARVDGMRTALEAVLARYMGDNNREDAEVLRCCDTIRALIDKERGE